MANRVYSFSEIEKCGSKSLLQGNKAVSSLNGCVKLCKKFASDGYAEAFETFGFKCKDLKDMSVSAICKQISPSLKSEDGTFMHFVKVFDLDEEGNKVVFGTTAKGKPTYRYHYSLRAISRWTPNVLWEVLYQSSHVEDYVSFTNEVRAKRLAAIKADVAFQAATLRASKARTVEKAAALKSEAERLRKESVQAAKDARQANKAWETARAAEEAKKSKISEAEQQRLEVAAQEKAKPSAPKAPARKASAKAAPKASAKRKAAPAKKAAKTSAKAA